MTFKNDTRSTANVTINVTGGETLDAATSVVLTPGDSITVLYDSGKTRWFITSWYVA